MDHQTYVIANVKRIFSDLEKLEDRLEADPGSFLRSTIRGTEFSETLGLMESVEMGEGVHRERLRWLEAGRRGLTKMRLAGVSPPTLTPEELGGLEAIVLLEGRPALLVRDGKFETPPGEWEILESFRDSIEANLPRVGRIEVSGHPRLAWVGTGFLVAPDVIMTNRHVAVHFAEKRAGEDWNFIPGRSARIDFKEEHERPASAEFQMVEVIGIHSKVDLALVRVEFEVSADGDVPTPLTVHYRTPRGLRDRRIYVIGYPAWDGRRNDPLPMRRIFGGIYNVKRLQPGTVRNFFVFGKTLKHDASTLGGNSGSCVIDLDSGKVIGLHYAGKYLKRNSAVALWKLRRSALLRKAGVQFD
jgi:S1-C subfamily serine protease